jgi:hypothetical protein
MLLFSLKYYKFFLKLFIKPIVFLKELKLSTTKPLNGVGRGLTLLKGLRNSKKTHEIDFSILMSSLAFLRA